MSLSPKRDRRRLLLWMGAGVAILVGGEVLESWPPSLLADPGPAHKAIIAVAGGIIGAALAKLLSQMK